MSKLFRILVFQFFVLTMASAAFARPDTGEQYWQIMLKYDANSVSIVEAVPFTAPRKEVRTPGLKGAPVRLDCAVSWLASNGKSLFESTATLPLGIRSCLARNVQPTAFIPDSGVLVIRTKGPDPTAGARSLTLVHPSVTRSLPGSDLPASLRFSSLSLPIPSNDTTRVKRDGPIAKTKVRDTGPDSNRLVLVVMGDGFTQADLNAGTFANAEQVLENEFLSTPPYNIYYDATNIYRIDVTSNESGADEPPPGPGIYKDTYFNSSFWTSGLDRLLTIDQQGKIRAFQAADNMIGVGLWDDIFILVNSSMYGGAGGTVSVASLNMYSGEIIVHEFGHTFAGLADEYDTDGSGPPTSDPEPNVDLQSDRAHLKWAEWVDPGTPLPTPPSAQTANSVGAFEGAKYWPTGIYRPCLDCTMRTLGAPFCPICKEAIVLSYMNLLQLADSQNPAPTQVVSVKSHGVLISVSAVPITPLSYEWFINGNPIPGSGSSILLKPSMMPPGMSTLTVKINHPTSLVRKTQISASYDWTVRRDALPAAAHDWSLYR